MANEWTGIYFRSETGKAHLKALGALNQALKDAWPYLDDGTYKQIDQALVTELLYLKLPTNLNPRNVDKVAAEVID